MTRRGFAPLIALVAIFIILVAALALMLSFQNGYPPPDPSTQTTYEKDIATPEPISESTDTKTIEEELNATATGDFEADINSMQEDASGL